MAEFDKCRSLNLLLVIEREYMKQYIEVIFTKIKTSPCYSFILEKLEEIKNCIRLYEKVNKAILTNIIKFESLDYFYEIERDNALDFVIDIEEKIAIVAENLTKSSTPPLLAKFLSYLLAFPLKVLLLTTVRGLCLI